MCSTLKMICILIYLYEVYFNNCNFFFKVCNFLSKLRNCHVNKLNVHVFMWNMNLPLVIFIAHLLSYFITQSLTSET